MKDFFFLFKFGQWHALDDYIKIMIHIYRNCLSIIPLIIILNYVRDREREPLLQTKEKVSRSMPMMIHAMITVQSEV